MHPCVSTLRLRLQASPVMRSLLSPAAGAAHVSQAQAAALAARAQPNPGHGGLATRTTSAPAQTADDTAAKMPPPPDVSRPPVDEASRSIANMKKRAHALQSVERVLNPFEQSFAAQMLAKLPPLHEVR